jgi:GTP-binding protein
VDPGKPHHSAAFFADVRFLLSAPEPRLAPPDSGAEVAFAGRSNAGKSSALNAITARRSLARTSKTPGRTQQLVFFALGEQQRLVDLPGYGYARVPEAVQRRWGESIGEYLRTRRSLRGLVLLMDIRHPLREFDLQLLEFCAHRRLPVLALLTKADKLKRGAASKALLEVRRALAEQGHVNVQLFSSTSRQGVEEARLKIVEWLADTGD